MRKNHPKMIETDVVIFPMGEENPQETENSSPNSMGENSLKDFEIPPGGLEKKEIN